MHLTKPPLDQNLMVSCEVEFDANLVIPDMPVKDRFYAGFFASERLNRSGIDRWIAREEQDGTIVLIPLSGQHDSSNRKGKT